MKIKRRGNRQGPSHRITISFTEETYAELRKQSDKLDYSLAEIARRVVDRGVVADVVSVTKMEEYVQLSEKLRRSDEKRIEGLQEHLDLKDQLIAQMQRGLEEYTEIITEQARDIQFYEQARVKDV